MSNCIKGKHTNRIHGLEDQINKKVQEKGEKSDVHSSEDSTLQNHLLDYACWSSTPATINK